MGWTLRDTCGCNFLVGDKGVILLRLETCKDHSGQENIVPETFTGTGYCVKCKNSREFTGEVRLTKTNRRMAQGPCPVCGTKVNRILGKDTATVVT